MRRKAFVLIAVLLCSGGVLSQTGCAPNSVPPPPPGGDPTRQHPLVGGGFMTEQLVTFDSLRADVTHTGGRWQIWAGDLFLKDFGSQEKAARDAVRIIHSLGLTQRGTVGSSRPVLEYWLADGRAPHGLVEGVRLHPFDPQSLRVEQYQGIWCLRDARHLVLALDFHAEEARQALGVIRRHAFTAFGTLGQGLPAMTVFVSGQAALPGGPFATPPRLDPGHLTTPRLIPDLHKPNIVPPPSLIKSRRPGPDQAPSPVVPVNCQAAQPPAALPTPAEREEVVPIEWREVAVEGDNHSRHLVCRKRTLAHFGANEQDARQAIGVIWHYHFTEQVRVGKPAVAFTYYLINGEAPVGLIPGANSTPFRRERLSLRQVGEVWIIMSEDRPLLTFADERDARQVLQVIEKHRFDSLCRVGQSQPAAMTYLVRTRELP